MNRPLQFAIETIEIERDRIAHGRNEPEAIKSLGQVGAKVVVVAGKGCTLFFGGIEAGPAASLDEAIACWLTGARRVYTAGAGQ